MRASLWGREGLTKHRWVGTSECTTANSNKVSMGKDQWGWVNGCEHEQERTSEDKHRWVQTSRDEHKWVGTNTNGQGHMGTSMYKHGQEFTDIPVVVIQVFKKKMLLLKNHLKHCFTMWGIIVLYPLHWIPETGPPACSHSPSIPPRTALQLLIFWRSLEGSISYSWRSDVAHFQYNVTKMKATATAIAIHGLSSQWNHQYFKQLINTKSLLFATPGVRW